MRAYLAEIETPYTEDFIRQNGIVPEPGGDYVILTENKVDAVDRLLADCKRKDIRPQVYILIFILEIPDDVHLAVGSREDLGIKVLGFKGTIPPEYILGTQRAEMFDDEEKENAVDGEDTKG